MSNLTTTGTTQALILHAPKNGKAGPRVVVTVQGRFFANGEPIAVQISPIVNGVPQTSVSTRSGVAQLGVKGLAAGIYTITLTGLESGVSGTTQFTLT